MTAPATLQGRVRTWCRSARARLGLSRVAGLPPEASGAGLALPPPPAALWPWPWALFLGGVVLATLGVILARPVEDADLWWHLAYARDMLARHTLIPDHTAYSWTPANGAHIYCAWLGQFVLYGIFRLGGLPLLFALRYAVGALLLLLIWLYARRLHLGRHPLTFLILLGVLLMAQPALVLKPALFSPVLLAVTLLIWMRLRSASVHAWRWCYALPVVMVLWVNTHGSWVCGALLLALLAAGEVLNALSGPRRALPPCVYRHLYVALPLAALAILATPYGIHYPIRLARSLLTLSGEELRTVRDYDAVLVLVKGHGPYIAAFGLAATLLVTLQCATFRRRGLDWALWLSNLAFAVLYARMIRTTFTWAPVFSVTVLFLLAQTPALHWPSRRVWRSLLAAGATAVTTCFAAFLCGQALCAPPICAWAGFGSSYVNPVGEAEFIRTNLAGCRLGNDYNSGGYLLWRLPPETRVLIDPRYFPYRSWYNEYHRFETAADIEGFLRRYPCDVWCLNARLSRPLRWFIASPAWKAVFYGRSAVVFARRGTPYAERELSRCPDVVGIHNLPHAIALAHLAARLRDLEGACLIVDGIDLTLALPQQQRIVGTLRQATRGFKACAEQDYERGVALLEPALDVFGDRGLFWAALIEGYHGLSSQAWRQGDTGDALAATLKGLQQDPGNAVFSYNAGILTWLLAGRPSPPSGAASGTAPQAAPAGWQQYLQTYLKARPAGDIARRLDPVAERILRGTLPATARPPFILRGTAPAKATP